MLGGAEILIILLIVFLCLGGLAILVGVGVWLYQRSSTDGGAILKIDTRDSEKDPLEILRRRYAQGEISKDEFERIRADLQGE